MSKEKKGFFAEFKEFIMRGNVIDMAVGVIIANAFGAITKSLVDNIFMPALGALMGDMDLSSKLDWVVIEEVKKGEEIITPGLTIGFGTFLNAVINFIIIAFAIFMTIKILTKTREITEKKLLKKQEAAVAEEAAPPAPTQEELLTEILSELKKQNEKK